MKTGRAKTILSILLPAAIALVVSLVIIRFEGGDLIGGLELKSEDARFVYRGGKMPERDIIIVAADYITQKNLGVWPMPLDYSTQVIRNLEKSGASVVAFSGTEDNPDNEIGPTRKKLISVVKQAMDPDRIKGRRMEVVLGGTMRNEAFMIDGAISGHLKQIVIPYSIVNESGALTGISTKIPDTDSTVRKEAIFYHDKDFERCYPSLSLAAAYAKNMKQGDTFSLDNICFEYMAGDRNALRDLPIPGGFIPMKIEDDTALFDINYFGPPGLFPSIPYMDVLLLELDPDILLRTTAGSGAEFSESYHNLLNQRSMRIPYTIFSSRDVGGVVSGAALFRRPGYPDKVLAVETAAGLMRTYIPSYKDPDPDAPEMELRSIYSEEIGAVPAAIIVDAERDSAFVLDLSKRVLLALDPTSGRVKKSAELVPGGLPAVKATAANNGRFARLFMDPATGLFYATVNGFKGVSRINAKTLETQKPLSLDFQPVDMAAGGGRVFALDSDGRITAINPVDNQKFRFEPPLDSSPEGITKIKYIEIGTGADSMGGDELRLRKIFALDTMNNILHIYNAENGRYRISLGVPTGVSADEEKKVKFVDITTAPGEDKVFVALHTPHQYEEGAFTTILLMADPFTDKWFSNSIPLDCPAVPDSLTGDDDTIFLTCAGKNGFSFKALNNTIWEQRSKDNIRRRVDGKIVLVGSTVEVAGDAYTTRFFEGRKSPGVEITANALKNILDGEYITRPASGARMAITLVFGLVSAFSTWYFARKSRFGWALVCMVIIAALWSGFCWMSFAGLTPGFTVRFIVAAEASLLFLAILPITAKANLESRSSKTTDFLMSRILAPVTTVAVMAAIAFRFMHSPGKGSQIAERIYELLISNVAMIVLAAAFLALAYGARVFLMYPTMLNKRRRTALAVAAGTLISALVITFILVSIGAEPSLREIGLNLARPIIENTLLPFVAPLFAIAICGLCSIIYFAFSESREKTEIKNMFSKYVNQTLVDQLVADPKKISLGGKLTEVTILFADIRNFSIISEKMEPEALVSMLNEFFSEMTAVIIRSGGTLDKFMGDCIMAFWGAPVEQENHSARAVLAMVEMHRALDALQARWKSQGKKYPPLRIGIGLNTGKVIVGNIGSDIKMEYTVIGAVVNTTQRIEQSCKQYGAEMLISKSVYERVSDMLEARPAGEIEVGRNQVQVHLYEVIRLKDEETVRKSIYM